MSLMDKVARLDSAMQRGLDNGFAFVFGGKVVPAEIEELLKQETEDNLVRTYEGDVEAPNVFHIGVSPKDLANLSQRYPSLADDFADQMSRYTRNKGWTCVGPVVVTIAVESGLRTGQLRAFSSVDPTPTGYSGFQGVDSYAAPDSVDADDIDDIEEADNTDSEESQWDSYSFPDDESEDVVQHYQSPQFPQEPRTEYLTAQAPEAIHTEVPVPPAAPATPTVSLLLQDGSSRTYLVHEGSNIIGRSNDADFRLPDTGVSRQHAEITWNGHDAILTDLQSTNGTTVNDTPIDNWLLEDGDVITVGHSHIEVRIVHPTYY